MLGTDEEHLHNALPGFVGKRKLLCCSCCRLVGLESITLHLETQISVAGLVMFVSHLHMR